TVATATVGVRLRIAPRDLAISACFARTCPTRHAIATASSAANTRNTSQRPSAREDRAEGMDRLIIGEPPSPCPRQPRRPCGLSPSADRRSSRKLLSQQRETPHFPEAGGIIDTPRRLVARPQEPRAAKALPLHRTQRLELQNQPKTPTALT